MEITWEVLIQATWQSNHTCESDFSPATPKQNANELPLSLPFDIKAVWKINMGDL